MVESAEGIGSRKWSFERTDDGVRVQQGVQHIALLLKDGEAVKHLLVTAPQLWDAANELLKTLSEESRADSPAARRLADMVAKAVNKTDYKDVLQP